MIDERTEPAIPARDLPAGAFIAPGDAAAPDKPSIGEKWWHRITYGAVGYGANLLLSLVVWDYMLSGGGRPFTNRVARGIQEMYKPGSPKDGIIDKLPKVATEMSISTWGGHVTMIPVKYLEDNAGYITHKLNQTLDPNYAYKDLELPPDASDDDYPKLARPPHHNTWGQIALRRLLGMAAVTTSGTLLNRVGMDKPLQNNTVRVFNSGIDATGSQSLKRFTQIPIIERYIGLAALDAYFTVITSAVTMATNRMFGKARKGEEQEDIPEDALSVDVPGITHNGIHSHGNTSHAARITPNDKALIQQENHTKSVQASRDAAEAQLSLPA